MLSTMELNVPPLKTRIGVEVPYKDETNGELLICLNYLEQSFGWTACGKTSTDVYGVLLQNGYGSHIYLNESTEHYVGSLNADVPQIWADLAAFEFLVENADQPEVFIPLGTYVNQHKEELIEELVNGMTPGDWFVHSDPDKPI